MAHYIDKDALVAEIEKRKSRYNRERKTEPAYYAGLYEGIDDLKDFLNTLEVKEVDLEKEIQRQYEVHKNPDNNIVKNCVVMTKDGFEYFAKHFFELGLKAQKGE